MSSPESPEPTVETAAQIDDANDDDDDQTTPSTAADDVAMTDRSDKQIDNDDEEQAEQDERPAKRPRSSVAKKPADVDEPVDTDEAVDEEEEAVSVNEDEAVEEAGDDEEDQSTDDDEDEDDESEPTTNKTPSIPKTPGSAKPNQPAAKSPASVSLDAHVARVLAAMKKDKKGGGLSTYAVGAVVSGTFKESIGARKAVDRRLAEIRISTESEAIRRGHPLSDEENRSLQQRLESESTSPASIDCWKAEFRRQCASEDAIRYGLTGTELNDDQLTNDQIVNMLLRPVDASASKVALKARLRQWTKRTSVGDSMTDAATVVERLFGGVPGMAALADRHAGLQLALESLEKAMRTNKLLEFNTANGDRTTAQIEAVRCNLDSFYTARLNFLDMRVGMKTHLNAKIAALTSLNAARAEDQKKLEDARESYSTFCTLFDNVLDKAKALGIVRIEGRLYEPILTPKGDHTRAYRLWREEGDIVEFVHRIGGNQKEDPKLFGYLYERGHNARQLAETLKFAHDPRLPDVQLGRDWHAFRNGIYNIDQDRWYEAGSVAFRNIPSSVIACMYYDTDFHNDEYEWYVHNSPNGWMDIPVPPMDTVCDTQNWSTAEKEWWFAGGGRMLYAANNKESWSRCWLLLGMAGSGKSTSLRFWSSFVPAGKIGVLNNRCEQVFVLQSLERSWIWTGLDIKEDWNLDATLWNTMVDGNLLSIARKGLEAKTVTFAQHGAIASNRIMNWPDINGALVRRIFVHMFKVPPKSFEGEDLYKALDRCRGAALKKINLAYRTKCASHGPGLIKDSDLPANIAANHQEIRREVNPLYAFLEGDDVKLSQNYYICASEFRKGFVHFCARSGLRGSSKLPSPTDSFFADTLMAKGLRFVKNPADLPVVAGCEDKRPTETDKCWIVGLSLRIYEQNQPNYVRPANQQQQLGFGGFGRKYPPRQADYPQQQQQQQQQPAPQQPSAPMPVVSDAALDRVLAQLPMPAPIGVT